ncbi:hypothetical protein N5D77_22875 [Comamonas thiooxydans]|uniref:Uncharacterized protein n=1 Tax=Comamonas thiooxydans TaxID=363952 RepID=A0AA42TWC1_9BURK|nr:hypothetical protein [Comamonas thiooxydans]MDH1337024.1 hypothetical protein [Comamonas thiooxydans]MDH1743185.1 hypothetical protein [Comamonas thiooxydans]MDH1789425.1 hypothetical protein [Comamonas thiooxydans]
MKASRTEPTVHCWKRRINGDYVTAAHTTHDHLSAVFAAERERLAAARPKRRRRQPPADVTTDTGAQLRLVG